MIKTNRPKELRQQLNKTLLELYHLEDLNDYKNNTIGKCINQLQKIRVVWMGNYSKCDSCEYLKKGYCTKNLPDCDNCKLYKKLKGV